MASAAAAGDWPQFQRDAARTADASGDVIRTPVEASWSVPVSSGAFGFASAVLTRGVAYAGTPAGILWAVDARTGAAIWTFQADGAIHSAPAVSAAALYFGSADGTLRALDPVTGGLLWALDTGNNIHASPAFDEGVVFAASNSGLLYAVDAATGGMRWSTELDDDYAWSSPAVDAARVYVATLGGKVFAVDRFTGARLWSVTLPAQVRAAPVAAGDSLYIGAYDGVLRALDPRDGSTRWIHAAAAPIVGSPAVSSTTVYFASLDGRVTALSRVDGSVRWTYRSPGELYSSPALIGGVLVVGSMDKTLHLLDAASGAALQSSVLSGRIVSAAALSRGRVAVLTDDGRLHAFKSPNMPPLAPADLRVNGAIRPAINTASAAFSWSFGDPDVGDAQEAFVLQIATGSAGFDQLVFDTGLVSSPSFAFVLESPLPEGSYVWRVRTYDLFSDSGPLAAGESFIWDRTRPQVEISSPVGGETFVASRTSIRVSFAVVDNLDPAPRVDAALVQLADEGSPRGVRPARVDVSSASVIEPLSIDDGVWRLELTATDFAGNVSTAASGSFTVLHDVRAPRTWVAVSTPQASAGPGEPVFITGRTLLNLSSIDDLVVEGDAIGLGVALQRLLVDGLARTTFTNPSPAAGEVFSSTFALVSDPDGLHVVSALAQDTLGNVEPVRIAIVAVDNTAPITVLSLEGARFPGPDAGSQYVSTATRIAFLGQDPLVNGVGSGLASTSWQDNGGPLQTYMSAFTLAEGIHALGYQSQDNVGNVEARRSTRTLVDATPPRTSLAILGGVQHPGPDGATFYASSATRYALSALDPVSGDVASGVALTQYQDNGGAFSAYSSPFGLAEGAHALAYRSQDNVVNLELLRSTNAWVDATPPATSFEFGAPFYRAPSGANHVTSATPITFASRDPALPTGQPGSGVDRIEVGLDGGAFATYGSAIFLESGNHFLRYRGIDKVRNVEAVRVLEATADNAAPLLSFAFNRAPVVRPPANEPWFPSDLSIIWSATDTASGIAFVEPETPVTMEGRGIKVVGRAEDNVGNVSYSTATVNLDKTRPSVDAGTPFEVFEGQPATFDAAVGDNQDDAVQFSWSFGDGGSAGRELRPSHVYADNGAFEAVLTAIDHAGHSSTGSVRVTVLNAPPTVEAGGDQLAAEGAYVAISSTFTDSGKLDTHTAIVDWGDGTSSSGTVSEADGMGSIAASHVYGDNGIYAVTVTVTDKDSGANHDTLRVTVANVAPNLASLPSLRTDEGSFIQLPPAAFTDSGFDHAAGGTREDFSATVEWGDGTTEPAADIALVETPGNEGNLTRGTIQARHAYGDNGSYPVTVTVRDDDGGLATSTFTVTVDNVAPALASLPTLRAEEGSFVQLPPAAFTDSGFDNLAGGTREDFTATIDWGDGTSEPANDVALVETPGNEGNLTRGTIQARHAYGDNGTYPVTVTVRDDDGGVATSSFTVTVDNMTPALASLPSLQGEEGSFIQLPPAAFTDPGFDNPAGSTREDFNATIDWGDGMTEPASDIALFKAPGGEGSLTRGTIQAKHAYGDNGTYPVTVTVRDDDGEMATSTFTVTVDNVSPALASLPSLKVAEGSFVQLPLATFSDPGFDNPAGGTREDFTAAINWGDGTAEPAGDIALVETPGGEGVLTQGTIQARHAYGDNGIYAVTVTVRDDDGGVATSTFTVTVANVAPTLATLPSLRADEGSFVHLPPAAFTDPGFDNPAGGTREDFSATVEWGDGTSEPLADLHLNESPGGEGAATRGIIEARHAYGDNGLYAAMVCVADDDGGRDCKGLRVTVMNVAPLVHGATDQIAAARGVFHVGALVPVRTMEVDIPGQGLSFVAIGSSVPVLVPPVRYSDPGFDNPPGGTLEDFAASIAWGDAVVSVEPEVMEIEMPGREGTPSSGTILASHQYPANGIYALTASVQDDDGGMGRSSFTVTVDLIPPISTVTLSGLVSRQPAIPAGAFAFLGTSHTLDLTAQDPLINGIAFGVQWRFRKDLAVVAATSPFTLTQVPFALAEEGLHRLEYFSVDKIGNEEGRLFINLAVDHTAPISTLAVGEPHDSAFGMRILSPDTPLSLSATDPPAAAIGLRQVASGVRRIDYSVDGGATRTWDGTPIRLPLGTHTVAHWGTDRVENVAAAVIETFHVLTCPGKAIASLGYISLAGTVQAGAADKPVQLSANGAFTAAGTSDVYGDVQAPSILKTGKAAIHGQETLSSAGLPAKPIDLAALMATYSVANDNATIASHVDASGVLNLASQTTLEITTGVYFLQGIAIEGGATLIAKGNVQLLVNGPVSIAGDTSVNAAGPSGNLHVFIAASTTMTVLGSAAAVARIYAPTSRLELGGSARLALCAYVREAQLEGTSLALGSGDTLPAALASKGGKTAAASALLSSGPDGAFKLGEVYAFPNPAVKDQVPTFHVEVGLADAVAIRIFDAAGRQVHNALVTSPQVINDGQGAQYAYEYKWQGYIPSGVYLYTIEAEKNGQGKLQKAGRLAVVR